MLLDYTRGLTAPPRPRRPPSAGAQQVRVDELARDAGTFEIGAEPGAAAIVEPFHPEGPPSPLQIGRAPGGDHAVVAVIVDHRLAVDVELAAVVRGEGEAVEAVLRDIDPPGARPICNGDGGPSGWNGSTMAAAPGSAPISKVPASRASSSTRTC